MDPFTGLSTQADISEESLDSLNFTVSSFVLFCFFRLTNKSVAMKGQIETLNHITIQTAEVFLKRFLFFSLLSAVT